MTPATALALAALLAVFVLCCVSGMLYVREVTRDCPAQRRFEERNR